MIVMTWQRVRTSPTLTPASVAQQDLKALEKNAQVRIKQLHARYLLRIANYLHSHANNYLQCIKQLDDELEISIAG